MAWKHALAALEPLGFETAGIYCYGIWNGWSVALRFVQTGAMALVFAVRLPETQQTNARRLARTVLKLAKSRGCPGISGTGFAWNGPHTLSFAVSTQKGAQIAEILAALDLALRESGVVPADACAIDGTPAPTHCAMLKQDRVLGYRPVNPSALERRIRELETRAASGSVLRGALGAFLGMLAGVAAALAGFVLEPRLGGLPILLLPLISALGYIGFRGKPTRAALPIVLAFALVGLVAGLGLMPVVLAIREKGIPLGPAFRFAAHLWTTSRTLLPLREFVRFFFCFLGPGIPGAWAILSSATADLSLARSALSPLRPRL